MSPKRVAVATIAAVCSLACSQQHPPAASAPVAQPTTAQALSARDDALLGALQLQLLLNDVQGAAGVSDGVVPAFELLAPGGGRYSSRALVGRQPFVTVFFATWCDYCQSELRSMQRAFQQIGPMPVIPVSADGPETWDSVPGYLASFGIHDPAVRATDYRRFSAAYNPADTLPSLAIVGRNGTLIDYLRGYDPAHAGRLMSSLRQAKTTGPLPLPELNAVSLR